VTIRISERDLEQILDLADLLPRATSARDRVSLRTTLLLLRDIGTQVRTSRGRDMSNPPRLQCSLAGWSLGDRNARARIGCKRLMFGGSGYDHASNFTERGNDIRRNRV
jgi:hypothetical protein